ncbi:MAG: photosystem reaction center subunit H [Hapalosiphonaceae cyanobacterium JJU2]|nr:MAG: photosystem reaction center subunit H [Hapalosiphonaceae cyanobacterium JJU2]
MPLFKLEDFDPTYRDTFGGDDIKGLPIYTEGGNRIGTVIDALVDPDGRFRYLVIETESDFHSKRILLPIGLSRIDYSQQRVYVDGLSKQQVENLPAYRDDMTVDYDYEEQVRRNYRPEQNFTYDRDSYNYQNDASLYNLNEQNHQTFKLYEERLIANKNRIKTGEVTVGKHIETETATVSVPIEKERVVIERVPATTENIAVSPDEIQFQAGEVARIELYEETPEIQKEAFVREEVRVKKVVDKDVVEAQETIRREELDIQTEGNLPLDETNRQQRDIL